MSSKLCSVVIPVYNGAKYLRATLESFFSQDYENKELILVDDASQDESSLILNEVREAYPDIVRLIRNPENRGLAQTLLSGSLAAHGEYMSVFGQDDLMFPDRLSTLVEHLEIHHASMICSNAYYLLDGEKTTQLVNSLNAPSGFIPRNRFLYNNPVIGPSALFRKHDFERIDLSIFRFKNSIEWLHWFQYANMDGVYYLAKPLLYYRRHARNLTNSVFKTTEYRDYRRVVRSHILARLRPSEILLATTQKLFGR